MSSPVRHSLLQLAETPSDTRLTYSAWYRHGVALLSAQGIEHAAQEALWILEAALGIPRLAIYVYPEREMSRSQWDAAMTWLTRRAAGEPLQYVLGIQEFCGRDFRVAPGVFIPRPETELVLQELVAHALPEPLWLADVCTGSGCIAVMMAIVYPEARVYATDCSPRALEIARDNAVRFGVDQRLTFALGDLLEPFRQMGLEGRLSAITANPPYIPTDELLTLPKDVREFEPRQALDGGADGLAVSRRLLKQALTFLRPGGMLVLEIGEGQMNQLCQELEAFPDYALCGIRRDPSGIERVLCMQRIG
ncbi:MAG: peptide chain release factor N(5)-glutamine methyltransferase [Nitrospirae bacterium]|nr:MAG: peptide chain release factor N(5)-glutamine methyltransferase [Nitrospirota bacterium]